MSHELNKIKILYPVRWWQLLKNLMQKMLMGSVAGASNTGSWRKYNLRDAGSHKKVPSILSPRGEIKTSGCHGIEPEPAAW